MIIPVWHMKFKWNWLCFWLHVIILCVEIFVQFLQNSEVHCIIKLWFFEFHQIQWTTINFGHRHSKEFKKWNDMLLIKFHLLFEKDVDYFICFLDRSVDLVIF